MIALAVRKRHQFLCLFRAEKALRNILDVRHRAHNFHVDADRAIHGEREQAQVTRMRGVELETGRRGKGGLSLRSIAELEIARRDIQVSSQQDAQTPSREDE